MKGKQNKGEDKCRKKKTLDFVKILDRQLDTTLIAIVTLLQITHPKYKKVKLILTVKHVKSGLHVKLLVKKSASSLFSPIGEKGGTTIYNNTTRYNANVSNIFFLSN